MFSGFDQDNAFINQYLSFETQNQKIHRGEISTSLYLNNNDLFSNNSTIYENNNFQNKILIRNYLKILQVFGLKIWNNY